MRKKLIEKKKALVKKQWDTVDKGSLKKLVKKLFYHNKLSVIAIAFKLGWSYPPTQEGLIRLLPRATTMVLELLGFNNWDEYRKTRSQILRDLREGFTQKLKDTIKERDKGCILCRTEDKLHVHHLDEDLTNNNEDNLVTVCQNLHRIIHSNKTDPIQSRNTDYWIPRIKKLELFVKKVCETPYLRNIDLVLRGDRRHYQIVITDITEC